MYGLILQNCQRGVLQAYFVYKSFTVAVEDFFYAKARTEVIKAEEEAEVMKKKLITMVLSSVMVCALMLAGCGGQESDPAPADEAVQTEAAAESDELAKETLTEEESAENGDVSDQEAADQVAALIDAIYVQQRTDDTDEQCAQAKAAWDALTDAQKELVEGENADPDYFGRDTGDASKDDPRNQDEIGENEILVVSFGTSFNDSRVDDIKGIEDAIQEANPDWFVRRAFTAQIILNHVQARDGEHIDNMDQALERAVQNGVKNLVIQPTHLMHGAEYDELMESVEAYRGQFETVKIAEPLLGEVGVDASVVNEDKAAVADAVLTATVADAGYGSLAEAHEDGTAFVFLGHGTFHTAKVSYSQMQTQFTDIGCVNAFVGTVEGDPEETACEEVLNDIVEAGYRKVILRPLMVVAGDHANNDMAGDDEDSWISIFKASGKFESVDAQIAGLGSIPSIQELYVQHTKDAMDSSGLASAGKGKTQALTDGVYSAEFKTDSSMFRVSEACDGKGTLTVKDGEMVIHISLGSKNIVNLFPGLAEDAQKDGAELLKPTIDTVTYSDGMTEEVYGFDVPVPALDTEFDLALIGTKGKWYDHKVSVSGAESAEGNGQTAKADLLEDGIYSVEIAFEGGSGKAQILSPVTVKVTGGEATASAQWNSPNYDYMLVDGKKYLPVNKEGDSLFEIPILCFDQPMQVVGDTVAMSKPHEVEYEITFRSETVKKKE